MTSLRIGKAEFPGDWVADAVCAQVDPLIFFVEKGESNRPAKTICWTCPAREACLQYALDTNQEHGVWGGYSERERRRLADGEEFLPAGINDPDDKTTGFSDTACGTLAGYQRHTRHKVPSCQPCKDAINRRNQARRAKEAEPA